MLQKFHAMLINRYVRLQLKSIQRNNESFFFVIFITAIFACITGFYWNKLIAQLFSSVSDFSLFFIFTCGIVLFNDYVIKYLHKRNFIFPYLIKCTPESNRLYTPYYLLKELTSIWNWYLLFFFFTPVFYAIYDFHGIINAMMLFAGIFLLTILVSNMVFYLNMKTNKLLHIISHFLMLSLIHCLFYISLIKSWEWLLGSSLILLAVINYYFAATNVKCVKYWTGKENKNRLLVFQNKIPFFRRHAFFLYISLHTRMILRSPMLRNQTTITILMTVLFIISLTTKEQLMEDYIIRYMFFSLIFLFCPLSFISFFSTEGAFFDRLILSPKFRIFLKSRYLECVLYSSLIFFILLSFFKETPGIYYMTAMFLYCTGFILLLNFPRVFYANHKQDISTVSKAWSSKFGLGKDLYTIIVYLITMSLVLLIHNLFSALVATNFMFWTGLIFGIFSPLWLTIIHKSYMKHDKYRHLENYRK